MEQTDASEVVACTHVTRSETETLVLYGGGHPAVSRLRCAAEGFRIDVCENKVQGQTWEGKGARDTAIPVLRH